jgi:hypothetical protein
MLLGNTDGTGGKGGTLLEQQRSSHCCMVKREEGQTGCFFPCV